MWTRQSPRTTARLEHSSGKLGAKAPKRLDGERHSTDAQLPPQVDSATPAGPATGSENHCAPQIVQTL